jgi:hypothetical protein
MGRKPNSQPQLEHRFDLEEASTAVAITGTPEEKSLLVRLHESEHETQIMTARKYPRDVRSAIKSMQEMATIDETSAAEMNYALPRGGKTIEGPSIRFAEAILQSWGNARSDARVIEVNKVEKYIEAEGIFLDLQTNMAVRARMRRSIRDKYGNVYNDDMIGITGNAAVAIARRNAILAGIPKAAWRSAYEASRKVAAGTIVSLPQKRKETLAAFMKRGVDPARVLLSIGVQKESDISLDDIATLRGMWSALQSGEATVEEMFPVRSQIADESKAPQKRRSLDEVVAAETAKAPAANGNQDDPIAAARAAGRTAYYKGVKEPPEHIAHYKSYADAWRAAWREAEAEDADADNAYTAGAVEITGEEEGHDE